MLTVDRIYYDLGQANDENNDPQTAEIHYLVAGAESVQEAIDAASEAAPAKFEGISLSGFDFDDLTAPGSYKITARYRRHPDDDAELGGREISLDIGANTDTRTECLQRVLVTPEAPTDVAAATAINVGADGEVKGCTVLTGYQTYSEAAWLRPDQLTTAYRKALTNLVGCVNNAAFRGYAAGEVRFEGCSGQWIRGQKGKIKITYRFSISPNSESVSVASWNIEKLGWDFAWVKYRVGTGADGNARPVPHYAVVDRVSRYEDFGRLLLGE
jgi:hypothetical protein